MTSPSVVLLVCHDLGRHLGAYGVESVRSTNIDRLASEGILFGNAFSTSCGCSPSRASIATGRYPHANGVMGLAHTPFDWSLFSNERHVASLLASVGYETALFGFQHVSVDESVLGFQHTFTDGPALQEILCPQIERFLSTRGAAKPLYMEVNLEEPHRPFDQGGASADRLRGVSIPRFLPHTKASEEEMAQMQGAIYQADLGVGRILAALDDAGMTDNTITIFVGDHGLAMPRAKGTLYDPGIEVACMIRWPNELPAGARFNHLTSHVDVVPSLLEALNVQAPENHQGRSFFQGLLGKDYGARREVFAEKTFHSYYDPMRAIRTARHKLIVNFETAFAVEVPGDVQNGEIFLSDVERYHGSQHPVVELYDLDTDPLEVVNIAGQPRVSTVESELKKRLAMWMRDTGDPLLDGPIPSPQYGKGIGFLTA